MPERYLELSNGVKIYALVGCGFDGSSEFYATNPNKEDRGLPCSIPKKDVRKVLNILNWYIKTELKLQREGAFSSWYGDRSPEIADRNYSNPYVATYLAGQLEDYLRKQRKVSA